MKTKYCQCTLHKDEKHDGYSIRVTWIPQKYAKIGKVLKLQEDDDSWSDGWVVKAIGDTEENMVDMHKAIRNHRKNTGDSLPKT